VAAASAALQRISTEKAASINVKYGGVAANSGGEIMALQWHRRHGAENENNISVCGGGNKYGGVSRHRGINGMG
jgi:hypothetical protein